MDTLKNSEETALHFEDEPHPPGGSRCRDIGHGERRSRQSGGLPAIGRAMLGASRRRACLGFTLLEIIIALAVVGATIVIGARTMGQARDREVDGLVASQIRELSIAGDAYARANYASMVAATGAGPVEVSPATLIAGGFLAPGFRASNGFGHALALLVRQPGAGQLEILASSSGGTALPDARLGRIARKIGAARGESGGVGGVVSAAAPASIRGVEGAYEVPLAAYAGLPGSPTAGHVVAKSFYGSGTVLTNYLYRYDVGTAEANTMRTHLSMGTTNDINAARNIESIDGAITARNAGTSARAQLSGASGGMTATGEIGQTAGAVGGVARSALTADGRLEIRDGSGFALTRGAAGQIEVRDSGGTTRAVIFPNGEIVSSERISTVSSSATAATQWAPMGPSGAGLPYSSNAMPSGGTWYYRGSMDAAGSIASITESTGGIFASGNFFTYDIAGRTYPSIGTSAVTISAANGSIDAPGDVLVRGSLGVIGNASMQSNLNVAGNLTAGTASATNLNAVNAAFQFCTGCPVGPAGPPGPAGPQGPQGPQGPPGPPGS